MHKNKKNKALEMQVHSLDITAFEPRIHTLAHITVRTVENIDSTNMDHRHWERLVSEITGAYAEYDGFVILMGTNTMAYCSAALSFALPNIGKPVIITGAQIPAESINSDARTNIVNAVRTATMNLGGVFVVFGSKIILGCRAKKASESDTDAFKTFNAPDAGQIGVGITLNIDRPRHRKPLKICNGFDDHIACLTLIPGFPADALGTLLDNDIRGIILRAYGSGDIPESLLPVLLQYKKRKVPVVITTQCPGGATIMGLNDVGLQALHTGVIQAFDMCMEAMSTKLMWLIKQKTPYGRMKKIMEKNLVGEVNPSRSLLILNQEME